MTLLCNPCRYSFMRVDSRTGIRIASFHRDHRILIIGHTLGELHAAVLGIELYADTLARSLDRAAMDPYLNGTSLHHPKPDLSKLILTAAEAVEDIRLDRPEKKVPNYKPRPSKPVRAKNHGWRQRYNKKP